MRAPFAALFVGLLAAHPASAASPPRATAQGVVEATILQPLTLSRLSDLDFGVLAASQTLGGAVTIDPANGAQYAGGTSPACLGGGACPPVHASQFSVHGEPARSYVVSTPAALVASGSLQGSAASAPELTIESLTVRTQSRPASGPSGTLDINGQDTFSVGGTLVVPAGTGAAHYQATLSVIITYS
jgi:hypothetical protein